MLAACEKIDSARRSSIVVDERWADGIDQSRRSPAHSGSYWMHSRAANLVLQTPFSTMRTTGTFALRSPIFFKLKIFTGVSFTAVAEISS